MKANEGIGKCVGMHIILKCHQNGALLTPEEAWNFFNPESRKCKSCYNNEVCKAIVAAMDGSSALSFTIHCIMQGKRTNLSAASKKYNSKTCKECPYAFACQILLNKRTAVIEKADVI